MRLAKLRRSKFCTKYLSSHEKKHKGNNGNNIYFWIMCSIHEEFSTMNWPYFPLDAISTQRTMIHISSNDFQNSVTRGAHQGYGVVRASAAKHNTSPSCPAAIPHIASSNSFGKTPVAAPGYPGCIIDLEDNNKWFFKQCFITRLPPCSTTRTRTMFLYY
jgi:hypothetical protein